MSRNQRSFPAPMVVTFFALAFQALPASAHQQWLSPNFHFQTGDSAWLSFDHTFGDQRFRPSSGPGSYYSWWIIGTDGVKRGVPHLFIGKTRTVGEVELTEAGTYRLEAVEDQMPWTMVKVDGKNTWQPGTRADFEASEIVRSNVYFTKSVAYVTLGALTDTVVGSSGDPLEIAFESHPNDLRVGQRFQVRVLASDEPLVDHEVRVFSEQSEGHDAMLTCSTNKAGRCDFTMTEPGRYLIETSAKSDQKVGEEAVGFVHGYSVMVEVKASPSNE